MAGRKSLYTPDRIEKIINALSVGAYQKDACAAAGITDDTFANWQKRYSEFSERVTRAKSEGWIGDLAVIRRAALQGDWRAAGEHLDRTGSPYRKASDVAHTVTHRGTIAHRDMTAFSDEQIDALAAIAEQIKAGAMPS